MSQANRKRFFVLLATTSVVFSMAVWAIGGVYFFKSESTTAAITCDANQITEYPTLGNSRPWQIIAGSDGNLWFTQDNNRIGRITPSGVVNEFPTALNVLGHSITRGADGNVWFTQGSGITGATGGPANPPNYNIGKMTPAGIYTEYQTPVGVIPWVITNGPDGNVWFGDHFGGRVFRVTPSGTMTPFGEGQLASNIGIIITGPDGNLWISEQTARSIVKMSSAGTVLARYPLISDADVWHMASGPDGNIWIALTSNEIAKMTTSGVFTEYQVPWANGQATQGYSLTIGPHGIAAGPDGNMWFTGPAANKLGRITMAGVITQYDVPTANSRPIDFFAGPDGNMWFTEADGRKIGTFSCQNMPSNTGVAPRACGDGQSTTLTFNEFGQAGYRPTSPNNPKGTVVTNQYQPSGVQISATNSGEVYIASSWVYGSPANYWAGPSGDNILGVNSNPPVSNPTTTTFRFVNPATGAPATVSGSTISFVIGDTEISPQPRVIIRTYDLNGNLIETRNMTLEREAISFSAGNVHRVEFFDNGGDGHVLDDFRYGSLQCGPAPVCNSNTDCGSSTVGGPFCQGNSAYRFRTTPTCNNPGTSNATCTYPTNAELVQNCAGNQTCSNGACVTGNVTCSSNTDCGANGFTGGPFCQGNAAYRNFTTYSCNNAGTTNSFCTSSTAAQLQQTCSGSQTCSNGSCVAGTVTCSANTDCGTNSFTGGPYCQGNASYRNFTTHTCNNAGTTNSSCTSSTSAQLQSTCGSGQACSNGSCGAVTCSTSADCGTNGFVGGPFCQGNAAYRNFTTYTCNNPGASNSSCSNSTTAQLQTTCTSGQTCASGTCTQSTTCSNDAQCGAPATGSAFCQGNAVYKFKTTPTCNSPGTGSSTCSYPSTLELQQTCASNQTCSNGACVAATITCSANSDCGTNAFSGGPYCQGNAAYRNFTTYTCNNAGTANSSCSNSTTPQLQATCTSGQTCSNGSCATQTFACSTSTDCGTSGFVGGPFCQGNGVYRNFTTYTCNSPGTVSASCSSSTVAQIQTSCSGNQMCSSGACTAATTCSSNSDCGAPATGGAFCQGNGVYKFLTTPTCNSPGTSSSTCSYPSTLQLQQTCASNQTCSNGACVAATVACNANSDCGTNSFTGGSFCQGNGVYRNFTTYTCNNAGTASATCTNSTTAQVQQTCSGSQTCSNGACTGGTSVACNSNTDCGTNGFTGGLFCQGNASYRNFTTYTCNNAGTTQSSCTPSTTLQLQQTCSGSQTCSNGTCGGTTCTPNSYKTCLGNTAYWYDSCGTQGSVFQVCTGGQVCQGGNCVTSGTQCTPNASQRCVGNALYWYDSCGSQGSLSQTCSTGQVCSNNACVPAGQAQGTVSTNVTIRNLSSGNLIYSKVVNANPSDILQVSASITSNSTVTVNNVTVKKVFPANLLNNDNVTVDGVANSGNIATGINIGSIAPGQTRTVTFYVQVAPAQNFPFGSTTIQDPVEVTSTDLSFTSTAANGASILVTRTGVGGATSVPTGWTNNFWVDSFFLPLILSLLALWLWKVVLWNRKPKVA